MSAMDKPNYAKLPTEEPASAHPFGAIPAVRWPHILLTPMSSMLRSVPHGVTESACGDEWIVDGAWELRSA